MLRISIASAKGRQLLVLEGKLIAPWTNELLENVRVNVPPGRELVIDLQGVTDISPDGEETLYNLMVQGTKFRGGGVFIQQVLKQLAQRARRDGSI